RLQALHADVTEATSTNNHNARTGFEHRDRLLHRVDRREAGVGERSDVLGLERGVELDHRPGGRLQEVGEAAVTVDAGEGAVQAVHVVARATRTALAARDVWVDDHGVPNRDVGHGRSNLMHPAGV